MVHKVHFTVKTPLAARIKYVTKEMSGDSEFRVQGTLGDYSQKDIKLTGQLPIIEINCIFGFGIASLQRDGFGEF